MGGARKSDDIRTIYLVKAKRSEKKRSWRGEGGEGRCGSGRMSGEKNRNGRSATGRRGSRRNNSRCKSMADKGGSVPRGKGRSPSLDPAQLERRIEILKPGSIVPGKGGSSFRGNASFKNYLFADFQRKFSPLSGFCVFHLNPPSCSFRSLLILPFSAPSPPPPPVLKLRHKGGPIPWLRMYGKFACWLNSMKLLRKKEKKKKKSVNPCKSKRKSGFYRVRKFDTQLFLFSSTRFAANRKRKILVLNDCGLNLDWKRFADGR